MVSSFGMISDETVLNQGAIQRFLSKTNGAGDSLNRPLKTNEFLQLETST